MTDQYQGEDRRSQQWHLKKEVPIATIITMIIGLVSGTIWIDRVRNDVDMHWQAFNAHVSIENDRRGANKEANGAILDELRTIRKDITSIKISLAKAGVDK